MITAKQIGLLGLLLAFLAGTLSAVVIVPPIIYFASISIAGFLANALISLGALAAVAGVANWKLFNSPVPSIISALFGAASKLFIGLFAMLLALLLFYPVSMQQLILSSSAVLLVSALLLFLRDYRLYRASQKPVKRRLLASTFAFALFFAIIFVPSAYFAIEHRAISTQQEKTSASGLPSNAPAMPSAAPAAPSLLPDLGAAAKQAIAPSAEIAADYKKPSTQGSITVWFLPQSSENCIVEIGGTKQTFSPKKECKLEPDVFSELQFCPISIKVPVQCQTGMKIIASGSCSDIVQLQCINNQLKSG